jgi:hypothetical protein
VFRGDVARLEDMMAIKDAMSVSAAVRERGRRERGAQGRNVAEEDTNHQCAERCGDRGAVYAPCRWLLEDTRPARARREQVTVPKKKKSLSDPLPLMRRARNVPPLHHNEGEEVHALSLVQQVICQRGRVVAEFAR